MLFNILEKTFRVAYQPLATVALLSFFLYWKKINKNKWGLFFVFCFCFFLFWRFFADILSSRYCCFIIIPCIVFTGLFFKIPILHKNIVYILASLLILAGLFITPVISIFSSYRNVFVFDAQNEISTLSSKDPGALFFIQEKNFERISQNKNIRRQRISEYINSISPNRLISFSNSYCLWGKPIYFVFYHSDKKNIIDYSLLSKNKINRIYSFSTNKNSSSHLVILKFLPQRLEFYSKSKTTDYNLISNGTLEKVRNSQYTKQKMQSWIKSGASFYDSDSVLLPDSSFLIPTWVKPILGEYPKVSIDDTNPIEGKHSLHISFTSSRYPIYFLNKFVPTPGLLSCAIKSMNGEAVIQLSYESYNDKGEWEGSSIKKYIFLPDTKTHLIQMPLTQAECNGNKIMFLIRSENADLLIDDLAFTPFKKN